MHFKNDSTSKFYKLTFNFNDLKFLKIYWNEWKFNTNSVYSKWIHWNKIKKISFLISFKVNK